LQRLFMTKLFVPGIKKGTSQSNAKAAKDEYYSANKAQENEPITTITSYKNDAYKENRNEY